MSTTLVGAQGEAKVISKLTDLGWGVGKPLLDLGVDLLAYKINHQRVTTVAIQVKSCETKSHHQNTCFGNQFSSPIEGIIYIIVCPSIDEFVVIPWEEIRKKPHWHSDQEEWKKFKDRWDLVK